MTFYKCKICGWSQERKSETISHIESQHPPESWVQESDTL